MGITYETEKWIQSQWQKQTRLYTLTLCQNIFGEWIVTKTWGSAIKKGFGQSQDLEYIDYQSGLEAYCKLSQKREKRGYKKLN